MGKKKKQLADDEEIEAELEAIKLESQNGPAHGHASQPSSQANGENSKNITVIPQAINKPDVESLMATNMSADKKSETKPESFETQKDVTEEKDSLPEGKEKTAKDKAKDKKKKEKEKEKAKKGGDKKESLIAKLAREHQEAVKKEEERLKKEAEEEERKREEYLKKKEEEERLKEEKRKAKKLAEKEKKERLKKEGKLLTEKQKKDRERALQMLAERGVEVGEGAPTPPPKVTKPKKARKPVVVREESVPSKAEEGDNEVDEDESSDDSIIDDWEKVEQSVPETGDQPDDQNTTSVAVSKKDDATTAAKTVVSAPSSVAPLVPTSDDIELQAADESDSGSENEDELGKLPLAERLKERGRRADLAAKRNPRLRAPIICVLGHVDVGKTSLLDKLRRTNVQGGEAGGITQQIGATNVPASAILANTKMVKEIQKYGLEIPGLLIIDTPGHASFSNMRDRGSSLCDLAILVVDLVHGLEPQTIESIKLLIDKKVPFIISLNKVDRLYDWKSSPGVDIQTSLTKQAKHTREEFDERVRDITGQFAEQGLNVSLAWSNPDPLDYQSMVPTSAHSGDGLGNLMAELCLHSQKVLRSKIMYTRRLAASLMEVKALPGLGTTVDIALVTGKLREGQTVVLPGSEGPIVSQVRGLLTPQPMKEMRVKGRYLHHKVIAGATGVKLLGKDLERALPGLPMFVARHDDEVDYYKKELEVLLRDVLAQVKLSETGVYVQSSTLGSLEALMEFLRSEKIPCCGVNIGPVHKKDVTRASAMLEKDPMHAMILAFDVRVDPDARTLADSLGGVKIFEANIIYHLFDAVVAARKKYKEAKQIEFKNVAVFPCKLKILPDCVYNKRDPIVMGVKIDSGFLKEGTPLCVPSKESVFIGTVSSVESNHVALPIARAGEEVCIKIENTTGDAPKMFGRHFDETDLLVSRISRASIDAVKDWFRDDMTKPDWQLMIQLKKDFHIL